MLAPNLEVRSTVTRYGVMHYYNGDQFIGHSLERYGEYSEAESDLWRKVIKPGDSVIDVGANIGALTLVLAEIVGEEGRVLAVEAQPENFELLKRNIELNANNVFTANVAFGDRRGSIKVPSLSLLSDKNYGAIELNKGIGIDVADLVMLDEFCPERRVDFIKIDVEGMEAEVLRGARNTLTKYRPILYVENDQPDKSEALMRLISELGYRAFEHKPPLYSATNYNGASITAEPHYISINALCLPQERVEEFADLVEKMRTPMLPPPKQQMNGNKDWACIVRLGGIGDDLIAASVLRPLKQQGYKTEVITQEPQSVVFENNPYLDKLTIKTARELPQDNQLAWQHYWWGRSMEFKKFVNLSHSVEVLLAKFSADTAFWWPFAYRRKICGDSYLEAAHDVVEVPHEFGPTFFPTMEEKKDIAFFRHRHGLMDKPLIAWVIGGTRIDKIYPLAGMVIARLLSEFDVNVLMLCAPSPRYRDAGHAEQVMNHVKLTNSSTKGLYEIRDIEGQHSWPIRRMLTLAQMSDLVIGPDTGVMWAVAMESVPKIMLHSHASADNITKHWINTVSLHADQKRVPCWPCHLLHETAETCHEMQKKAGLTPKPDDIGAACISDITVQMVIAAIAAVLPEMDGVALSRLASDFPGSVTLR